MELMARYEDNHFDLAIVDPPYGINRTKMNIGGKCEVEKYGGYHFDEAKPTKEYWEELKRVSKNQITFFCVVMKQPVV
jgi:site-specific DNA-methyltransferase (adenine-specific)